MLRRNGDDQAGERTTAATSPVEFEVVSDELMRVAEALPHSSDRGEAAWPGRPMLVFPCMALDLTYLKLAKRSALENGQAQITASADERAVALR